MKKIFVVLTALLCVVFSAQAELNKKEVLTRIGQRYSGIEGISGKYEVSMSTMGDVMKMPVNFWQKGKKLKMDMSMNRPGMPEPMEMSILIDGDKVIQYQKMMNTVITIDINKLPENMRQQMKQQQGFMMNDAVVNQLYQVLDKVTIEEKTKGGKAYYLITVNDLSTMGNVASSVGMQGNQDMFKKMLMWVNTVSLFPEKIEFLKDTDTPGMWVDILNINTAPFSDSVFKLDIPADAKYMEM